MSNLKQKILQHLKNDVYCQLGVSKIQGVGVFALRTIPKGFKPLKSLIRQKEVRFTPQELEDLPASVRRQMKIFCYYNDEEMLVPSIGLNGMDISIYLNHSKEPNVRFNKKNVLEAIKEIPRGEELLLDYDISFGAKHFF